MRATNASNKRKRVPYSIGTRDSFCGKMSGAAPGQRGRGRLSIHGQVQLDFKGILRVLVIGLHIFDQLALL